MEQNKFLKVFAIFAFLVLAGVSCWATADSLKLLLEAKLNVPFIVYFVVSLIFFVMASYGLKMIVDSLNSTIFIEHKGWHLIGGVILMLAFWVFFSLPTNTHTFFYYSEIKDVAMKDLEETNSTLIRIVDDRNYKDIIDLEKNKLETEIGGLIENLKNEVNHKGLEGVADRVNAVLIKIEGVLNTPIQRLILRSNTQKGREEYCTQMENLIREHLKIKLKEKDNDFKDFSKSSDKKEIKELISDFDKVQKELRYNTDKTKEPTVSTAIKLSEARTKINKYCDVLLNRFGNNYSDKLIMTKEDQKKFVGESNTQKMRSVFEVLKDYFRPDKIKTSKVEVLNPAKTLTRDKGFLYWVLLGTLVDIGGFIFFAIAFKRKD